MTQNPANALLCVGDSKGVVSMWSPNSEKPLAKMLCHHNVVSSIAAHPNGSLMATSCADRSVKVWDLRNLSGPVNVAVLSAAADNLSYSQKGLLGASMGNVVQVYRSVIFASFIFVISIFISCLICNFLYLQKQ